MRVLLVSQYYAPEVGAPHVRLAAMVRRLVADGHEVEIVTAMPNHPTGRIFPGYRRRIMLTEHRDGARVHRVWVYAALGSGLRRMVTFATFSSMSLLGMVRAKRPDVVLVESPPLFVVLPAMLFRVVRRTPYVLLVADLWPDAAVDLGLLTNKWLSKAVYGLERRAYRSALAIAPTSDGQVATLRDDKHIPDSKIVLMPNGVDLAMFAPGEPSPEMRELLAPNGEEVVIYAGTHGFAHSLDTVVDAAHQLAKRRPSVRFVLVGDGSDKARVRDRVQREQMTNVLMLDGRPVEDIADMMRVAKIGLATNVSSPVFDGIRSAKIFPIMASAIPVLYSGRGESPRLVEEARGGLVTPPEDAGALADAVEQLLSDPEQATEMGRRGRAYATASFSWDVIVERFVRHLERLL